ncbi:MAG: phytoene desaturase family protein [Sediminibacterium sp.]|nr:phytoene desaturase family protein [Sediminibacterium sp.]
MIIGSGIAGLAASIRLVAQGYEVHVYEKSDKPGGKLGFFSEKGYQFDTGPSLFTQPHQLEALLALVGEKLSDYFTYHKMPVSCHYFYEDGTFIEASADPDLFAKEAHKKTGEPVSSIKNYLAASEKLYTRIGQVFLNYSLHKISTLFKIPLLSALGAFKLPYITRSMHKHNERSFRSKKLVQLFNRYATYNGSNPYVAPSMLTLIAHLEHNEGSFYPTGGMISITNTLVAVAKKIGVQFYFNSPVQKITTDNNKVTGVVVNDSAIDTDVVVSNADVYFTYLNLLSSPSKAKKILEQERSSSALIFYWGIKKEFPQLSLHNIFFTENYEAEFAHLFDVKIPFTDPTVYINITSVCEPGIQAPAGKQNWFVMVNVPANTGQDWVAITAAVKKEVLAKLERMLGEPIEPLIETEKILDPLLIEANTASYQGSLYGTSSNAPMAAFLRHPNFSKEYNGLYFVGGSVHPGGGIPLCLKSAEIMSNLVAKDRRL